MIFENFVVFLEKNYDRIQQDGSFIVRKGLVDRQGKYKFVVNSGDHQPPHIHIALNNQQIGSYYIASGKPYRIHHNDTKVHRLVELWFKNTGNIQLASNEWARLSGSEK
jgi:hypothetical protein